MSRMRWPFVMSLPGRTEDVVAKIVRLIFISALCGWFSSGASAQVLTGSALVKQLQAGGHVIVMRHASSPREAPNKQTANSDNMTLERQLDEKGRVTAAAMGDALGRLKIPIGEVLTSPTYRARETIRLAKLPQPRAVTELGDGGQSMQTVARAQAEWLRKQVAMLPRGTNTLLVTHMPNIAAAFPDLGSVADGEALVFGTQGTRGKRGVAVIGRIKIEEWPSLQ